MSHQIPFYDPHRVPLAKPWLGEEEASAVAEVVRSGMLCQGEKVAAFEAAFAAKMGARHAVAIANGSAALLVSLEAMGVGPGDEVIVPDMTFISTATAALRLGAKPVLGDITLSDHNLDPDRVEALISPRTKVILPVHYAGQTAEMDALRALAARHGLKVLEDAAEAHLARYRGGALAGCLGDAGIFSFTPTKLMTTGEGGMITTDDDELAARCRLIRNFGDAGKFDWQRSGFNYRMTDMAAAIGLLQLGKLDAILAERRRKARRYDEAFAGEPVLVTPWVRGPEDCNYQLYTLRLELNALAIDRDTFLARLQEAGVSARLYYPALHRQGVLAASRAGGDADFPASVAFAASAFSLPIFTQMTDAEQDHVIATVLRTADGARR